MFHLLKIRTSIDICCTEKCKVTFGLKYIFFYLATVLLTSHSQCFSINGECTKVVVVFAGTDTGTFKTTTTGENSPVVSLCAAIKMVII